MVAEAERLLLVELVQVEDQVVVELDMILLHLLVLQEMYLLLVHLKETVVEMEHHNNLEDQVVAVVELLLVVLMPVEIMVEMVAEEQQVKFQGHL